MNNQKSKVERAFNLAQLLLGATGRPLCLFVGRAEGIQIPEYRTDWVGPDADHRDKIPWVMKCKAWEALALGDPSGLSVGPHEHPLSTEFRGWVRLDDLIVAASNQTDSEDLFWAAQAVSTMLYTSQLHHVGQGYESVEAMLAAIEADEVATGHRATWPAAEKVLRAYIWREDPALPMGGYYIEHLHRPHREGDRLATDRQIHVDLHCPDALALLQFMGRVLGTEPELFTPSLEDGRAGALYVAGKDRPVGLHARAKWWILPGVPRPINFEAEVARIMTNLQAERMALSEQAAR